MAAMVNTYTQKEATAKGCAERSQRMPQSEPKSPGWSLALRLKGNPMVATCPPEERGLARDEVKLLVLNRRTGETEHARFHQIADYLESKDLIVVNNSRTLPASLPALWCKNGEPIRLHLAVRLTKATYIVERRLALGGADKRKFRVGERILIGPVRPVDNNGADTALGQSNDYVEATVIGPFHPNSRLWYIECHADLWQVAVAAGSPIRYGYLRSRPDIENYQTVFGRESGSSEMPSAARPFTKRTLESLKRKGIGIAEITLHTGVSSHEVTGPLSEHPFLPEWYRVPACTADLVNRANRDGRRVIAVGTTVVRALASVTHAGTGRVKAGEGFTTVVVTPESPVPSLTGLITGLHEDDTSHLALLYAFVAQEKLRLAYQEAVSREYLWHEFGDSNLIV